MKTRQRVLPLFALLLLPLLLLSGCSRYDQGADQLLRSVSIQAQVDQNGDMHVTERWDISLYDRDRPYSNLFKSFPASREQEITDFSVTDNSTGKQYAFEGVVSSLYALSEEPDTCYLLKDGSQTELGWFMPPVDEGDASFTLSYTVTNSIERYSDVGVLYHGFVGSSFSIPIAQFSAVITLPEGASQDELRGWLHVDDAGYSMLTIQSGSEITLEATEVPAETFIEARICAPSSLFPGAVRVEDGNVLDLIADEEQAWADEWEAEQERERFFAILSVVLAAAAVLAGLAVGLVCRMHKRRHKVESPEYYREIPEGSSPGSAACLFYYYSGGLGNSKAKGRAASATMLSLARKGWISFEENPEGLRTRSKDDDLLIRLTSSREPLTLSEQCFYELLQNAAGEQGGEGFPLDRLEQYAKKNARAYQNKIKRFELLCRNELEPKGCFESRSPFLRCASLCSILALILAYVIFAASDGRFLVFSIGLAVGALLVLLMSSGTPRLSVAGETELGLWNGLRHFLLDFSNMTEYGVFQLPLWEEYLVYASMMGISEEVAEQLKKAYPQVWTVDESSPELFPRTSYLYWTMYRPLYHHYRYDFSHQFSRTIENAGHAAQSAIDAMSGGSRHSGGFGRGGGGFGGGGGGFGSGGGGGAR